MGAETKRTGRKRGNNEGSIRQRPDGTWEARITLADGQRKSVYGKTRAEVQQKMTATLRDVQQGLPVATGRQPLSQFLGRWLEDVVKPSTRRNTYESYEQKVRVHIKPALGKLTLEQVTPQRIQAFLNQKASEGLSPRSVQYLRIVLRIALGRALKWNLVARNAATLVDPPRLVHKKREVLSPDQANALLTALKGDRMEMLVTLTLATGLRRGEALALRWSDVDLDAGTLSVEGQFDKDEDGAGWSFVEPKGDASRRTLELPPFVIADLRAHRTRQLEERLALGAAWEDYDLIFPTPTGTPQNGDTVSGRFSKRVRAVQQRNPDAKLPYITLHGLRHSAATMLLARGMTLGEIQKVLGHSQISLTANLYSHASKELMGKAATEMERIFRPASGLG